MARRKRTFSITLSGRALFMVEGLADFYGSPKRIFEKLLFDFPQDLAKEMGVSIDDWLHSDAGMEWREEYDRERAEKELRRRRHGLRLVKNCGPLASDAGGEGA